MQIIEISTDYIKLQQLLKWAGIVDSGSYAAELIQSGNVILNNKIEIKRGKKVYDGDKIVIGENIYIVKKV